MTLTTETTTLTPQEQLQARLSDPKILDALNRLLDRAELLAFSADALDGFIRRGDEITTSVNEMVVDARNGGAPAELMDAAAKLPQLARAGVQVANTVDKPEFTALLNSGILEQLGKPETIEALKLVLSKIDLLAFAVKAADEFVRRGDVITDNIGESLGDLRKLSSSIDFEKLRTVSAQLPALLDASDEFIKSGASTKLKQLADAGSIVVDSGMLDPATVKLLAQAGKIAAASYIETQAAPRKDIKGVFDLLGALKDPGIQHALGFFVEFMKRYSAKMK
jgi:uncharacterized protein YjgD (DUF1641 family)